MTLLPSATLNVNLSSSQRGALCLTLIPSTSLSYRDLLLQVVQLNRMILGIDKSDQISVARLCMSLNDKNRLFLWQRGQGVSGV